MAPVKSFYGLASVRFPLRFDYLPFDQEGFLKTFEEALGDTMFRECKTPVGEGEAVLPGHPLYEQMEAELANTQGRYSNLLDEIQNHPETAEMIRGMAKIFDLLETTVHEMMIVAFSHGVMVGIEMEKEPLLVGRSTPPEVGNPTESKT